MNIQYNNEYYTCTGSISIAPGDHTLMIDYVPGKTFVVVFFTAMIVTSIVGALMSVSK